MNETRPAFSVPPLGRVTFPWMGTGVSTGRIEELEQPARALRHRTERMPSVSLMVDFQYQ